MTRPFVDERHAKPYDEASLAWIVPAVFSAWMVDREKSSGDGNRRISPTVTPERAIELHTMRYQDFLETDEWKSTSRRAKAEAGERCRFCGSPERLNTHHVNYARRGQEIADDVVVLCKRCHMGLHRITDAKDR